jgi:hypothetical protein
VNTGVALFVRKGVWQQRCVKAVAARLTNGAADGGDAGGGRLGLAEIEVVPDDRQQRRSNKRDCREEREGRRLNGRVVYRV